MGFDLLLLHCRKALAAVDGAVVARLEGNLRLFAAVGAFGDEHFPVGAAGSFARRTAFSAALRLILEALFGVEFLLTGGEREFLVAVLAHQCLVLIHVFTSLLG